MKILVAITGASGSIYGLRLIEELNKSDIETHIIISEKAEKIITHETKYKINEIEKLAYKRYNNQDLFAAPSSGSY